MKSESIKYLAEELLLTRSPSKAEGGIDSHRRNSLFLSLGGFNVITAITPLGIRNSTGWLSSTLPPLAYQSNKRRLLLFPSEMKYVNQCVSKFDCLLSSTTGCGHHDQLLKLQNPFWDKFFAHAMCPRARFTSEIVGLKAIWGRVFITSTTKFMG